jgi:hypothetical protein
MNMEMRIYPEQRVQMEFRVQRHDPVYINRNGA